MMQRGTIHGRSIIAVTTYVAVLVLSIQFMTVPFLAAQARQEGRKTPTADIKRIVTRDLQIITPKSDCRFSPDGISWGDNQALAWWKILSIDHAGDDITTALQESNWREDLGASWLLLQSRLERGESYGVEKLAAELSDLYTNSDGEELEQTSANVSAGRIELIRWQATGAASNNRQAEAMVLLLQERQLANSVSLVNKAEFQAFAKQYQLIDDWRFDSETGICWQIPPASTNEEAESFFRLANQYRKLSVGSEASQSRDLYRLLSAASISTAQMKQQWNLINRSDAMSNAAWDQLIEELTQELPKLEAIEELVSQLEMKSSWGHFFAARWLAGRTLLQRTESEYWMAGASYLLEIAFVQERELSTGDSDHQEPGRTKGQLGWARLCLMLVADKYGEVGETGKLQTLRKHLDELEVRD